MIREHRPSGYIDSLDRRQPRSGGSSCALTLIFGVLALCSLGLLYYGISAALGGGDGSPPQAVPTLIEIVLATDPPTEEATASPTATRVPSTPTLDEWQLLGTEIALTTATATFTPSSTYDYCYWLTPSPTPTPTLIYTPDDWSLTGTAVYFATHPVQTPTPLLPRELCRDFPTWTPTRAGTITPIPFPALPTREPTTVVYGTPPITLPYIEPPPTWTSAAPVLYLPITQPPPPPQVIEITSAPVVITSAPVVITQAPIIIYVTEERTEEYATQTHTPTETASYTATATETPTPTLTATPTNTATHTATASPTATPTETENPDVTPEV